jgi:sugar phosphate isomerase/epimerase
LSYPFALCSEVYKSPIEETIRRVAELGFAGIEIAPFHVAPSAEEVSTARRAEIRRAAEAAGVQIIGLHWLLVSPTLELHLTTPDGALRERTLGYLESLARFCADLGGRFLVFGSPKQRSVAPGDDPRRAFERAAEGLRRVARTCAQCGVRFLLEPLHPKETNFLNTVEEALALQDAVGSPAVGTILDCKAMSGMPEGILGTIRRHGRNAGHFHTNDPSGKGPGMGNLDFAPVLRELEASGYRGWVSSEPFDYAPDSDTVARTALETLRRASAAPCPP